MVGDIYQSMYRRIRLYLQIHCTMSQIEGFEELSNRANSRHIFILMQIMKHKKDMPSKFTVTYNVEVDFGFYLASQSLKSSNSANF